MNTMHDMEPLGLFPDPRLSGIDGLVGFHIRLASAAVYQHFTETFSDLGLTQKQVAVLWLIEDQPGIAQADIGRRLKMDRASVMAIVNRMQDRGFVRRGASEQDRRRQTLSLTEAGHGSLEQARSCIAEHEKWLKDRFTPAETAMLVELLRRVYV
ncbi:DNA-binding transcriptional regulator, MarR family [Sphingobium sp. AP50]|nr:DNA-binding transcriptional regulator, MarR family [Sphingobium sp. AP50]